MIKQLSTLTKDDKTKLLAHLDGIRQGEEGGGSVWIYPDGRVLSYYTVHLAGGCDEFGPKIEQRLQLPPYLDDYNTIGALIDKVNESHLAKFAWREAGNHVSPVKLCDALLIATGMAIL